MPLHGWRVSLTTVTNNENIEEDHCRTLTFLLSRR